MTGLAAHGSLGLFLFTLMMYRDSQRSQWQKAEANTYAAYCITKRI